MALFGKKKSPIICIGSVSKDIFLPTDEGIIIDTPEDLTSKKKLAFELGGKIRILDRYEAVGGVAANVSWGLSKLGYKVACYSRVGDDSLGSWAKRELEKAQVDTSFVVCLGDTATDLSAIIVHMQTGERTIFHNRDANEKLTILPAHLEGAEWVFISALNGPWKENVEVILAAQERFGFRIALNPGQHNLKEDAAFMRTLVSRAEVLLLNKDEALELVQKNDPSFAEARLENELHLLAALHSWGPKHIGMTDGLRGAWASGPKEVWHGEASVLRGAKDATGAGDAFSSGFFAAHLAGQPAAQALRFGLANSASVVKEYGAVDGLLSKEALEVAIQKITPVRLV